MGNENFRGAKRIQGALYKSKKLLSAVDQLLQIPIKRLGDTKENLQNARAVLADLVIPHLEEKLSGEKNYPIDNAEIIINQLEIMSLVLQQEIPKIN